MTHRKKVRLKPHPTDFAFTLSEVLITLVVIGIVAAITVPTIMARQREQATVEKVKKFYSTINQAFKRAIVDTGLVVDEWDLGTPSTRESSVKLFSYFKPYLSITADDCGAVGGICRSGVMTKYLNGNDNGGYYAASHWYKAILNDGSVIFLSVVYNPPCNAGSGCGFIYYDINGLNPPNTWGKDTFAFLLYSDKILPRSTNDCNLSASGLGCAKYVLSKGNMDYLH